MIISFNIVLMGAFTLSCSAQSETKPYGLVSVDDAIELMEMEDLSIIDVRRPEEVAEGMISKATHLDFYSDGFREKLEQLDREGTYLVYCFKGGRSGKTLQLMDTLGFKKVYDLEGGYERWIAAHKDKE